MPYYYRSKFNNSYSNPNGNKKSDLIEGGAYKSISKTPEEKEKEKNTIKLPMPTPIKKEEPKNKISEEKLKKFINFSI